MRYLIMHRTTARWEAGAIPDAALVARVGEMIGGWAKAGSFIAGEGLRPSSEGVRLRFAAGTRAVVNGPFAGDNELPAGFDILRATSIDDAVDWATRQAGILGDGEVDIRPVTEPWDIGVRPPPAELRTRRYMVLRKASAATEAGLAPTAAQRAGLARLIEDTMRTGVHLAAEMIRPSRRGRRYRNARDGVSMFDGPFLETKELVGGYVVVKADSIEDAHPLALEYISVVEAEEVDLRELE